MKLCQTRFQKLLVFGLSTLSTSIALATSPQVSTFNQLADEYFDTVYLPANTSTAVSLGLHQYDNQLEPYSKISFAQEIIQLKKMAARVQAVNPATLDLQTQGDRELVLNSINARLLALQNIKQWEKNPDYYSSGITNAAFVIMERAYAPETDRLRSLIAREKLMPLALLDGRKNLKNPPKIYTEIAIEQMPGLIEFFSKDVPQAFNKVTDNNLKDEFVKTNKAVIAALKAYQTWLTTDLLPRSHGDFRIGADNYRQKLQYEEMVDLPLNKLLQIGWADLKKNQQAYQAILQTLAKDNSTKEILDANANNHPTPDKLLTSFSDTFTNLMAFIKQNKIITIPSEVRPTMEETPPFMRAITLASMDTPGPFEKHATNAFFNVTLPEPSWSKAKTADYMTTWSYQMIDSTSIHEAYPGHYVQFLWMHQVPDKIRKILGAASNAEGWAHYCEQMMLDEGYGKTSDPRQTALLRLGQLKAALLRNARFIVGIEMHTGNMTFNQAVDFFVKQGYQNQSTALIETKRGTSDATYLYYTLGKLQILKLRADMQAKLGSEFNLEDFHNNFMKQGFAPIKIVRKAMLGNDSPSL